MARTQRKSIHYVNNADFSQAVVDYVTLVEEAKESKKAIPKVRKIMLKGSQNESQKPSKIINILKKNYRKNL